MGFGEKIIGLCQIWTIKKWLLKKVDNNPDKLLQKKLLNRIQFIKKFKVSTKVLYKYARRMKEQKSRSP